MFTCNVNSGEEDVEEEEKEEEEGGGGERKGRRLTTVTHGAASGGGGGRTQLLATVEVLAMTVLTISSPVFFYFSLYFFFFFLSGFSPLYPYSAPLFFLFIPLCFFLLCFPSLLPLFFFLFFLSLGFSFSSLLLLFSVFHPLLCSLSLFVLVSPVFIGKKQGGRDRGCHCAAALKTVRGACPLCFSPPRGSRRIRVYASGVMVGIFLMFKRERDRIKIDENRGKKNMLLPLPRTSRGRRRPTVSFKTASFGSLFFLLNNV
jgi:hypothetical protein